MTTTVAEYFTEGHRLDAIIPLSRTSAQGTSGWKAMRDYHKAVAILLCGALAANAVVDFTITQCTDDTGVGAKAITGKAIATLDTNDDNAVCAIELDASELDVNGGFDWINVTLNCGGAAACLTAALLIRYQPRFKGVDDTNLTEIVV